jgi:hypothetical protein
MSSVSRVVTSGQAGMVKLAGEFLVTLVAVKAFKSVVLFDNKDTQKNYRLILHFMLAESRLSQFLPLRTNNMMADTTITRS